MYIIHLHVQSHVVYIIHTNTRAVTPFQLPEIAFCSFHHVHVHSCMYSKLMNMGSTCIIHITAMHLYMHVCSHTHVLNKYMLLGEFFKC